MLVCAASLALRWLVPPIVYANASYDDLFFVTTADNLFNGEWLGTYDPRMSLSKGMGYPAFLALCRFLHLPVLLGQHLLLLIAAATVAVVAARLSRSAALGLLLFALLALDPSFLGTGSSRVIRDGWYASVCLLVFGITAGLLLPRHDRPASRLLLICRALGTGLALGVAGAMYWLGREERPWLIPALAVLFVGAARLHRRPVAIRRESRRPVLVSRYRLVGAGTAALVMLTGVQAVAGQNERTYGVRLTNDMTEGAFVAAYSRWESVDAGGRRPYVPISAAQRRAAYRVSPAAAELRQHLEGPNSAWLVGASCAAVQVCDDVAGGWAPWAIRQAVAFTGHYQDADEVQGFYQRLTAELETACASAKLTCDRAMPSMLPQPESIRAGAYAGSFLQASAWLVGFRLGDMYPGVRSQGDPHNYAVFARSLPGLPATLEEQNAREERRAPHLDWVARLRAIYGWLFPPLLVAAVGGLLLAPLRGRGRWQGPWLLALAAAVMVLTRLGLLALIDSTSFPAAESRYLLPASSALIVFTVAGVWLLLTSMQRPEPSGESRT
ncbi:MAG TPA: hypothetical protein VNA30_06905 [Mycobacteriales bacterium]|nr:hypothetical protein [Mycobacteriales bacterium]